MEIPTPLRNIHNPLNIHNRNLIMVCSPCRMALSLETHRSYPITTPASLACLRPPLLVRNFSNMTNTSNTHSLSNTSHNPVSPTNRNLSNFNSIHNHKVSSMEIIRVNHKCMATKNKLNHKAMAKTFRSLTKPCHRASGRKLIPVKEKFITITYKQDSHSGRRLIDKINFF